MCHVVEDDGMNEPRWRMHPRVETVIHVVHADVTSEPRWRMEQGIHTRIARVAK